jgi:hypothetical protein
MAAVDYDVYFRHALINGGNWAGYRLAWPGLGGAAVAHTQGRPYLHYHIWRPGPDPYLPDGGSWAGEVWDVWLLLSRAAVSVQGRLPADWAAGHVQQRLLWLRDFRTLPAYELKAADGWPQGATLVVMTGYDEYWIEPQEGEYVDEGAYLVRVQMALTTV